MVPVVASRPQQPVAGRYLLLDQVGAGAMGTVWRAWDLRERRHVAAKLLTRRDGPGLDPTSDPLLLRFVREQSLRIQHPHVLSPTGWAAEDDRVVFTMQLVRGGTLGQLLARHGPLPSDYVAVLVEQLLEALGAVHAAGFVHRDVKPANLLLEPSGSDRPHLWLGDFGVAVRVRDEVRLTQVPEVVGTDGYIAPEATSGALPDPRHDLYAVGVVAVEALAGLRATPVTDVRPGPLAALLRALVASDPADRPESAAAALSWLRQCGVPAGTPWRAAARVPSVPTRAPAATPRRAPGATPPVLTLAARGRHRVSRTRIAICCFTAAAVADVIAAGLLVI